VQLPGAERAFVDPAKVRDYLLSPEHPVGRGKARFFAALGFRRADWPVLQAALLQLAREAPAHPGEATAFGQKYRVGGMMQGPNGRVAAVETAWIVLVGEDVPRFVTAFPGPTGGLH
jgi:hypothetical protein